MKLNAFLPILILFAGVIVYFLFVLIKLYLKRLEFSAIPTPPLDNFYHGHGITIKKAKINNYFLELFAKWTQQYGKSFVFFIRFRNVIFTTDPNILKHLTTDLKNLSKLNDLPNRALYGQRIAGWNSLLTGGGTSWAIKRKIMSKFFAKASMDKVYSLCKPYLETYIATNLNSRIGNGKTLELVEELSIIFMSFPLCLGVDKVLEPTEAARNVIKILEMIPKQVGDYSLEKLLFAASPQKIETTNMIINMRTKLSEHVKKRWEELRHEDEIKVTDLLGQLIRANEACNFEKGELISCIVDDLMTVYLVMDNNVKQIASMMMYLNEYPDIYDKLVCEIRKTEITNYQSLASLVYTEKVILESMRLSPALLRGTRLFCSDDDKPRQFGPYIIPSSTQFHFSQYLIHHDNEIWENAEVFNPERWTSDFKALPFTYMPFLVGPRGCLGKHFAMMIMKLVLATLLKNFDLEEKFDRKAEPVIDQGMAVMRIRNNVSYHFSPVVKS